jgi:hypothetical protein
MTEEKERRRAPRTVLQFSYTDISGDKAKTRRKIHDISPLGMRFFSEKKFMKGSTIQLDLLLPNFRSLLDISGKIVWCSKKNKEGFNTGMEFQDDGYKKVLVEDYIHYMKSRENHYIAE